MRWSSCYHAAIWAALVAAPAVTRLGWALYG